MSDVYCSSAVHCGCRNLLDASSVTNVAYLTARLQAVEAERDALRDQRDASFEDVASLNGCLERATARAEEAEAECRDLSCVFEARFAAAMGGEPIDRLDRGVLPEQIHRENAAVAWAIEKVGPTFEALRRRAERAEAECEEWRRAANEKKVW